MTESSYSIYATRHLKRNIRLKVESNFTKNSILHKYQLVNVSGFTRKQILYLSSMAYVLYPQILYFVSTCARVIKQCKRFILR